MGIIKYYSRSTIYIMGKETVVPFSQGVYMLVLLYQVSACMYVSMCWFVSEWVFVTLTPSYAREYDVSDVSRVHIPFVLLINEDTGDTHTDILYVFRGNQPWSSPVLPPMTTNPNSRPLSTPLLYLKFQFVSLVVS